MAPTQRRQVGIAPALARNFAPLPLLPFLRRVASSTMRLRCFVVLASLVACGTIPEPRRRPADAQEFCAISGATAPTLQPIDLWPIPTDPFPSETVDQRIPAALAAMQARIDLPWATKDGIPRLHRITDSYALALFPVSVSEAVPWSSVMRKIFWWSSRAWLAYVWNTTSDVWTFVGIGGLNTQLPRFGAFDGGLFVGLSSQGLEATEPGYHDVVLGESVHLRRLADVSAGQIAGISGGMPVLWRRDGGTVVVSCMSTTGPVASRRFTLAEGFEPSDGDAVRDQRILLVQRDAQQQIEHRRPGPAFAARVWVLDLRDGRPRFIGKAPGHYSERATNLPSYEAVAGAAWRGSLFNPAVDVTPDEGWGKISVFSRGPTAWVDVADERITSR